MKEKRGKKKGNVPGYRILIRRVGSQKARPPLKALYIYLYIQLCTHNISSYFLSHSYI